MVAIDLSATSTSLRAVNFVQDDVSTSIQIIVGQNFKLNYDSIIKLDSKNIWLEINW